MKIACIIHCHHLNFTPKTFIPCVLLWATVRFCTMTKKKASEKGDPSSAQTSKKQNKEVDPIQTFAERLRDHKDLESRWGVLQENRVEYFRGKDFISVLKNNPDLTKVLGKDLSEEDIGNLLLKRKLVLRCDRVNKAPRPGKKKLSKWPKRLEIIQDQGFSDGDNFFAWTFERRRPLWQTVLSFLVPVVTLACCLFPVFPYWCKLVVVYFCLTLLCLICGILFVRAAIFGFLWVLLGKRVWFFPHILAENASFKELIQFWPEPAKDDEKPPKLISRLAFTFVMGACIWLCVRHAPDEAARTRYHKKVSNIIDEVLLWSPKLAISGKGKENTTGVEEATDNPSSGHGNTGEDVVEHNHNVSSDQTG